MPTYTSAEPGAADAFVERARRRVDDDSGGGAVGH